jgi:hypothetical protein
MCKRVKCNLIFTDELRRMAEGWRFLATEQVRQATEAL